AYPACRAEQGSASRSPQKDLFQPFIRPLYVPRLVPSKRALHHNYQGRIQVVEPDPPRRRWRGIARDADPGRAVHDYNRSI
ncbi:MAG: hypothetical protein ACLFNQ_14305, partial [Spirochaetaceae bacterium]